MTQALHILAVEFTPETIRKRIVADNLAQNEPEL